MADSFRILVIDDSRDAAFTMKMLLTKLGHQVETADGGQQGIEAAKNAPPDIVFCDIGMPKVDGHEVARQLRADSRTSKTHLVALTGYAREDDRKQAIDAGFDQHLVKPAGFAQLQEAIAAVGKS